jgi:hypothetical protein
MQHRTDIDFMMTLPPIAGRKQGQLSYANR